MEFRIKSTVLSDVDREDSGIIPYVLKFAKDIKSSVDIIHVIDTRTSQGIYTPYSDSKSLTQGVQSYEQIIQKVKEEAEKFLSKHVGREASVLNYPLKVNYRVETGHIDEILSEATAKPANDLLMMSARPHGKVWETYEEIFYLIAHSDNPVLLIPSGMPYKIPENICFLTNLEENEPSYLKKAIKLLDGIKADFHVLARSGHGSPKDRIESDNAWQELRNNINAYHTLNIIEAGSIEDFVSNNKMDMIILFEQKRNILKRLVSKSLTEKLAAITGIPILVFYN